VREVCDQSRSDWIGDKGHDDWDGGRGTLDRLSYRRAYRDDHIYLELDQLLRDAWQTIWMVRYADLNFNVAAFHVAQFTQPLPKDFDKRLVRADSKRKNAHNRNFVRLLRPCVRSRDGETQREGEQNTSSSHSITSSACNTLWSDMVHLTAEAVCHSQVQKVREPARDCRAQRRHDVLRIGNAPGRYAQRLR
jgi:hypothetical protein